MYARNNIEISSPADRISYPVSVMSYF